MPPKPKQPRPLRCAYVEGRMQCRRPGTGNPPLCDAHRVVLEAEAARPPRAGEKLVGLLSRVLRGQKITDEHVHAGVEDFVDMVSRSNGDPAHDPIAAARARAAEFLRRTQGQAYKRPPPPRRPVDDAVTKAERARLVLGFAHGQKVTVDELKKRHRELARKHHPDRGGSVAKMQEVNAAVDQLMATL